MTPGANTGDGRLDGRVAVVTGAGRGLGRSIALAFGAAGADVALAARSEEQLATTAEEVNRTGGRALVVRTDVTDTEQVEVLMAAVVAEWGHLDILVNNAGILLSADLLETTDDEWAQVLATNLTATFACTRAAGRYMVAKKRGKVINVASNFAFQGVTAHAAYCATKAAVVNFTRAVAVEWAPFNVQVNALAPGYFATDLNAATRADADLTRRILRHVPAHRMGEPDEVAPWAVLLASSASDFMTGETIVIDGGQVAR